VSSTGSTNADLVEAARSGAPDGSVLRADHQTAGRGRLDRSWEAAAGANLLVSILFRRPGVPVHRLVRSVAVAARRAVARSTGIEAGLKWPNDLVVGDDKLGGILAQGVPGDDCAVVVGLGLNIAWAPEGATALDRHCPSAPRPRELMLAILRELETSHGDAELDVEYRRALSTLGRRVRVHLPDGRTVEGTASSVDADGRLTTTADDGSSTVFDTADIVHLRNAD